MSAMKGLVHVGVASANGLQTAEFFSENLGGEILSREAFPEQDQISTMVKIGSCALEIPKRWPGLQTWFGKVMHLIVTTFTSWPLAYLIQQLPFHPLWP